MPRVRQQFAGVGEFHDLVVAVVGDPDVVVPIDAQAVRIAEHALAPGTQVLALAVENDDRVGFLAALEDVDIPGRIGCHR